MTGGIEELKTTTYECNVLTFVSEVKQLQELNVINELNPENKTDPESKLILAINNSDDEFASQISDIHNRLSKQGRHPVGRMGLFHLMGLVKYLAYKWLNKVRDNEPGRIQLITRALPTTYDKINAENELFSLTCKDHNTLQSRDLNASLLVSWSQLHYELNVKAKTLDYNNIPLKDYLLWGAAISQKII